MILKTAEGIYPNEMSGNYRAFESSLNIGMANRF